MAALHRKFIVGRMPVVPDENSDKQLQFALRQSNRAIQELRKSPARKSTSDSLDLMTACVLFYCLACFQGHQRVALEQLRSGLKILREVDANSEGAENLDHHPINLTTLRAMFVTMDVQARGIMSDEELSKWEPHPKRKFLTPPARFRTFAQARYYFESAFIDMMAFRQELDVNPPKGPGAAQRVKETRLEHERQTEEMSDRLDEFLGQLSNVTSQADRESILGIRLFREQVRVYLKLFKGFDEEKHAREIDWHVDEQDMGVIVELAGELLKAPADLSIPAGAVPEDYYPFPSDVENISQMEIPAYSRPVFSSCSGLLSALWLVASRANSAVLRRRAIALMLDFPRREGVWDSVVAGRVAWESLTLEETALEGELGVRRGRLDARSEYIPEANKVRSIEIRYVATRVMEAEFQSVKQAEAGQVGVKKLIAW
ncbi:hypothetical protein K458DRAFT_423901 [Lentithecium fluviatile CBS 122367]|uniref:Uncharacterized protein n=1 Tax=Lentithecium fluviatile CBS 122367 TaxID=1168545 RepID=A0A6G1IH42_9PLEO|nr:hypothetical protein K458DRAFT_423901 [Lentithecium fluviatile CBS 122367]